MNMSLRLIPCVAFFSVLAANCIADDLQVFYSFPSSHDSRTTYIQDVTRSQYAGALWRGNCGFTYFIPPQEKASEKMTQSSKNISIINPNKELQIASYKKAHAVELRNLKKKHQTKTTPKISIVEFMQNNQDALYYRDPQSLTMMAMVKELSTDWQEDKKNVTLGEWVHIPNGGEIKIETSGESIVLTKKSSLSSVIDQLNTMYRLQKNGTEREKFRLKVSKEIWDFLAHNTNDPQYYENALKAAQELK